MAAGTPTLDTEYIEMLTDEYKVYLDQKITDFEEDVIIDLVSGMYYEKLRITGIQLCC